jgi:hypothetical protein
MAEADQLPAPARGSRQHPACTLDAGECRIAMRHWIDTMIAWEPIYDGNGVMTNSDPNTAVHEYSCATCSRVWQIRTTGGEQTLRDVPPPATLPA